jgi:acyl-CoA thioesterase FadM
MVYKVNQEEAKTMTASGRCVLVDPKTMEKVETPQEWLAVVEEKAPQEKRSDE